MGETPFWGDTLQRPRPDRPAACGEHLLPGMPERCRTKANRQPGRPFPLSGTGRQYNLMLFRRTLFKTGKQLAGTTLDNTVMRSSDHNLDRTQTAGKHLVDVSLPIGNNRHHYADIGIMAIKVEDLDADLVAGFLLPLERERNNSIRTRNIRLVARRKVFEYIGSREPELMVTCQKVLVIPTKRTKQRTMDDLEPEETSALLAAPNLLTWIGRRDRCLLLVALPTGLRVSELIGLDLGDVSLVPVTDASLHARGKGRKERTVSVRSDCVEVLTAWLQERGQARDNALFVTNRRSRFSRDGVERIVQKYVEMAARSCLSIGDKRVSPPTLRHTTAMNLLRRGVSCTVIALWLGHETRETTQIYRHADMEIKKKAMEQTRPEDIPGGIDQPNGDILAFLKSL